MHDLFWCQGRSKAYLITANHQHLRISVRTFPHMLLDNKLGARSSVFCKILTSNSISCEQLEGINVN